MKTEIKNILSSQSGQLNNAKSKSAKNSEFKDISMKVSEKDGNSAGFQDAKDIRPEYAHEAPVVKSQEVQKPHNEIIHYEEIRETPEIEINEENSIGLLQEFSDNKSLRMDSEVGNGYYLTIPEEHQQRLSKYAQMQKGIAATYKTNDFADTGSLVNITL